MSSAAVHEKRRTKSNSTRQNQRVANNNTKGDVGSKRQSHDDSNKNSQSGAGNASSANNNANNPDSRNYHNNSSGGGGGNTNSYNNNSSATLPLTANNNNNNNLKANINNTSATNGIYSNARFIHTAAALVGHVVQIRVRGGCVFEGVFSTLSKNLEVALKSVHEVDAKTINHPLSDSQSGPPHLAGLIRCMSQIRECSDEHPLKEFMVFKLSDIVTMTAYNIDLEYATRECSFTDNAIAAKANCSNGEKHLEAWQDESGLSVDCVALDESGRGSTSGEAWSADAMFKLNEQKFGVKTSFDNNLAGYTVQLERKEDATWRIKEQQAEKIAKEIERSPGHVTRTEAENGSDDEEAKYAAVVRPNESRSSSASDVQGGVKGNSNFSQQSGRRGSRVGANNSQRQSVSRQNSHANTRQASNMHQPNHINSHRSSPPMGGHSAPSQGSQRHSNSRENRSERDMGRGDRVDRDRGDDKRSSPHGHHHGPASPSPKGHGHHQAHQKSQSPSRNTHHDGKKSPTQVNKERKTATPPVDRSSASPVPVASSVTTPPATETPPATSAPPAAPSTPQPPAMPASPAPSGAGDAPLAASPTPSQGGTATEEIVKKSTLNPNAKEFVFTPSKPKQMAPAPLPPHNNQRMTPGPMPCPSHGPASAQAMMSPPQQVPVGPVIMGPNPYFPAAGPHGQVHQAPQGGAPPHQGGNNGPPNGQPGGPNGRYRGNKNNGRHQPDPNMTTAMSAVNATGTPLHITGHTPNMVVNYPPPNTIPQGSPFSPAGVVPNMTSVNPGQGVQMHISPYAPHPSALRVLSPPGPNPGLQFPGGPQQGQLYLRNDPQIIHPHYIQYDPSLQGVSIAGQNPHARLPYGAQNVVFLHPTANASNPPQQATPGHPSHVMYSAPQWNPVFQLMSSPIGGNGNAGTPPPPMILTTSPHFQPNQGPPPHMVQPHTPQPQPPPPQGTPTPAQTPNGQPVPPQQGQQMPPPPPHGGHAMAPHQGPPPSSQAPASQIPPAQAANPIAVSSAQPNQPSQSSQ